MGLKRQLLDKVKEAYPMFDEKTDWFIIEFEGSGDSFDSFHSFDIGTHQRPQPEDKKFEGDFDTTEHIEFLYEIIKAADVQYNWNDAGTTGRITYQEYDEDGELVVDTLLTYEDSGTVEDDDDPDEGWKFDYKTLEE